MNRRVLGQPDRGQGGVAALPPVSPGHHRCSDEPGVLTVGVEKGIN